MRGTSKKNGNYFLTTNLKVLQKGLKERKKKLNFCFLKSEHKSQQLQKDLEQIRLNTERQRIALETEKVLAEERRQIAAEMSENQRRLFDTIIETNQRMVEYREKNAENVTKLATEAATTAATSAILAAFRQQQKDYLSPQQKSFADSSTSTKTERSFDEKTDVSLEILSFTDEKRDKFDEKPRKNVIF